MRYTIEREDVLGILADIQIELNKQKLFGYSHNLSIAMMYYRQLLEENTELKNKISD